VSTATTTSKPIDRVLDLLDGVSEGTNGWTSLCPAHDDNNPSLSIAEGKDGRVLLKCFAGCEPEEIVAVLGLKMADLFPQPRGKRAGSGLTLEEYAQAKRLPMEFLKKLGINRTQLSGTSVVRMPYMDEAGRVLAARMRLSMKGNPKYVWRGGDKPSLYGLWRLADYSGRYVCLVEGESCSQTLWLHDFPALGLPGANIWKESWASYFERFERIYVLIEPDSGGEAILNWLRTSAIRDRVRLIRLNGFKDASALYLSDPDQFPEAWKAAMRSSQPWTEVEAKEKKASREAAWNECEGLARRQHILNYLLADLRDRNVAGEAQALMLIYLVLTSRFLEHPVSAAVVAPSSAGKSFVVESTLAYFPDSAYIARTGMSEKVLAYTSESLKNRFLLLYEGAALNSDFQNYLVRSLLSEGRVRYETVEKGADGVYQTRVIEHQGPTGLILTTTAVSLHPENDTRLLTIPVSDSPAQTQQVLLALARAANDDSANGSRTLRKWRALQEWLQLAEHRVFIPYANAFSRLVPPVAVRLRRDFTTILNLIKAHAILHQKNRERDENGRIIAKLGDYWAVRCLVNDLVSQGVGRTVSEQVRETVGAVYQLCDEVEQEVRVTEGIIGGEPMTASVAQIAKALGLERSSALRRIHQCLKRGFLRNLETKKWQPMRLVLGDAVPNERQIMPTTDEIREEMENET
jgi:hypothetical protein